MKINKTLDEAIEPFDVDHVGDFLSTAFYHSIDYWSEIDWNHDEYKKAKQELIDKGEKSPCYEPILAQVLFDGGKIHIIDSEDGEDSEYTKDLTLENLKEGVKMWILNPQYNRSGDAWYEVDAEGADIIIQFALFGEIIFG